MTYKFLRQQKLEICATRAPVEKNKAIACCLFIIVEDIFPT